MGLIQFGTKSGSIYEIDLEGKRMRRLVKSAATTKRLPTGDGWKDVLGFIPVSGPVLGHPFYFRWHRTAEETMQEPATVTTPVVWIAEVE